MPGKIDYQSYLNWFKRLMAGGDAALHVAAMEGKFEEVKNLLAKDCFDVDDYDVGYTPLHYSLVYNHYKCAVLLLDQGKANPNLPCRKKGESADSVLQGNFIKRYLFLPHEGSAEWINGIKKEKFTAIRLLTIYGITEDGVKLDSDRFDRGLIGFFNQMRDLFKTKCNYEQDLEKGKPKIAYEACQKLEKLWANLAKDETHPDVKEHYQQKADFYAAKVKVLESKAHSDEKKSAKKIPVTQKGEVSSTPSYHHHPAGIELRHRHVSKPVSGTTDETVPLLPAAAPSLN
jgi:ankyrin repeat protein